MKIYIVDDDKNTCKKLIQIIEEEKLGNVINFSQDPEKSLDEIQYFDVDLLIVDLLMPKLDGINLVKKIKMQNKDIEVIMLSQVTNKEMISRAYDSGIKYFINKPINRNEVKHVILNLEEVIDFRKKFNYLGQIFNNLKIDTGLVDITMEEKAKKILIELGIWGEKGADEIIQVVTYIQDKKLKIVELSFKDIICEISDNSQNFEQRIRRAIGKGMSNLAYIGLEDNLNNTFIEYSNTLYDFESIKKEMEYIRGKSSRGGKISLKKFIENIINI
ncbi:MAG: DNA-binding domain-containing protein [Clostridiales bacterium]|nr:DNA-binding domain-containing protein [Clostridiales bacterium]